MGEILFSHGELRVALEQRVRHMYKALEAVPEEHVRQADVDEWSVALADEFRVDAPELRVDEMYREPAREVKVDVSHDPRRYFSPGTTDRRIAGYRLVVRIPFSGTRGPLSCAPISSPSIPRWRT